MSQRDSYVDGVPLVLSKKYYPIPKSRYKEVECHIPLDALQENYDFNLERRVLSEFENYERQKEETRQRFLQVQERLKVKAQADAEAAAEKAAALVREYEEELAKQQQHRGPTGIYSPSEGSVSVTDPSRISSPETIDISPTAEGVQPQSGVSSVSSPPSYYGEDSVSCTASHVPQQQQQSQQEVVRIENYDQQQRVMDFTTAIRRNEAISAIGTQNEPSSSVPNPAGSSISISGAQAERSAFVGKMNKFNLSDFESDTANPFDNVEMKSINDMAVLASVLQNNLTCGIVPPTHPPSVSQGGGHLMTGGNSGMSGPQTATNSSTAVNSDSAVTNVNGMMNPGSLPYFSSYLSQNLNQPVINSASSFNSWTGGPTPTPTHYYNSHFRPPGILTSSNSESVPPLLAPTTLASCNGSLPITIPLSSSHPQLDTPGPTSQTSQIVNPSVENFANYYFPFTSGQAQSRLQTKDREFT